MRDTRRTAGFLLLGVVLAACGSRTEVERLTPDVLRIAGPDSVVRLDDGAHPSARYELSTVVDPEAAAPIHDLILDVVAGAEDWMDAELSGFGEIDGRTVDVLPEEPVVCDMTQEDDLFRAILETLFPTPECHARYVVVLPDGILAAWPDGFTLYVGTSSGTTWAIPVTGRQIAEHLEAMAASGAPSTGTAEESRP
ncbi:MAG: hypothetical protein AMS20_10080 [Gemmatimonas sp. SG8_28]|nr:MAG: hypothetical protein AMS20_10080 [Gemmatimonas sp. SG8_28]